VGPGNQRLFNYSTEAPASVSGLDNTSAGGINSEEVDISQLEGASDDPTFTKVVDRRWYQRNKHIYPASVWQEFDPEKDYSKEIRRDPGGNAFFFAK
jgi:XAP5 protein.